MSAPIFQRPDLALALSNRLLHPDALQLTSRDGLFLTGVRRIGKTTFIRRDLIPQLEKENALVIYIDLWENRGSISPAEAVLSQNKTIFSGISTTVIFQGDISRSVLKL